MLRSVLVGCLMGAVMPAGAMAAPGDLIQKPGAAGCLGAIGACSPGRALNGAASVVVSPDGRSAYATSHGSDSLGVFDRDPDGTLIQEPGTAGCVSQTGAGSCADGRALVGAESVAVSPDGRSVYVGARGAVAVFDREPDGALTQRPGTEGCVSNTGAGPCADGKALFALTSVVVTPDGKSVYAASEGSSAVLVFDRAASGTLTQKRGRVGCITDLGGRTCADGRALAGVASLAVSPNGRTLYAAAGLSDAVAVFGRAANGRLVQKRGSAGCISPRAGMRCKPGRALEGAAGVAVSPGGRSVYVSSDVDSAVAVFDRRAGGGLVQKRGRAGCVSQTGGRRCADGRALGGAYGLNVSADGQSVYVASQGSDAVAVFDRAPSGRLSQKRSQAGCVAQRSGSCAGGRALDRPYSVATSSDGLSLYVASSDSDAVAVFDRRPARARPIFALPGVNARQRGGRVVVRVTGRLVKTRGQPCAGRVAVGARTGARRARHVFRIQASGEGRCTYTTVFRFRVQRLRQPVRARRKRLLVRVAASYKGSSRLRGDRAPSVLRRVIR